MKGPVWSSLPQTAPVAEWTAWAAAHQVLRGEATIWTDCLAVQTQATPEGMQAVLRKGGRAGTWLQAAGWTKRAAPGAQDAGQKPKTTTKKTKAHVTISAGMSDSARWEAQANSRADEEAKSAARMHPQPAAGERAEDDQMAEDCGKMLDYAVAALCLWPPIPQGLERHIVAPRPHLRRAERQGERHQWQMVLGRWSCKICVATAFSAARRKARSGELCPGSSAHISKVLANPQGHALACVDCDGAGLVFCTTCGCYVINKARHLLAPCTGRPPKDSWRAAGLRRIASGRHPDMHSSKKQVKLHEVLVLSTGRISVEFAWAAEGLGDAAVEATAAPPHTQPVNSASSRLAALRRRIAEKEAAKRDAAHR